MDGDGQHPCSDLADAGTGESGYDIALTQRIEQKDVGSIQKADRDAFYRLINRQETPASFRAVRISD